LSSWIESANLPETDFPIQNLPYGVFRKRGRVEAPRVGVAIGDRILDVGRCGQNGLFEGSADYAAAACQAPSLNLLMSLGPQHWSGLRLRLTELLNRNCPDLRDNERLREEAVIAMSEAEMFLPCEIGDYTDFYASLHHATRVGKLFRPDNPLLPNYKHVPIAYHGRASSIVVSGAPVRRPCGQVKEPESDAPQFGPSRLLDYELEVGMFIGIGNKLGVPVPIEEADSHIFGLCLVNDWSARDIQSWEYQPLGPFLGKNFATTVSPWVVPMDALAPYRVSAYTRPENDPMPLDYLRSQRDQQQGAIDLCLDVYLQSEQMRRKGLPPALLSSGNFREMYWTMAQMIAHHTSNGCNLRVGDLIASGTVSGEREESGGCLLELTSRGKTPIRLPNGEARRFLEDGDEVVLRGYCRRPGLPRIGFGECRGVIQAAKLVETTVR
jgi:fumarylacetoacetase